MSIHWGGKGLSHTSRWPKAVGPVNIYSGATMLLDFLIPTLDPRVTFSRGTNATRINESGIMETVGNTTPRFDYNPVTRAPRGLLIEGARTNIILHSEDLGNTAWKTNFGAGVTVLTNQANGPDGLQKLDRITSVGAGAGIYQTFTIAFSTAHSVSMFVRQGTATTSQIAVFNTVAGVFVSLTFSWSGGVPSTSTSVGSPANVQYENFGGGLYRISFTFTSRVSGDHWPVYIPDTTAGLGTGFVGYAQLEAGGFTTSYIPTVASAVPRNADIATMTGTNFSSWYNQNEGTFVAAFEASPNTFTTYVAASNGVVAQNSMHIDNDGVGNMRAAYYSGSSAVALLSLGPVGAIGAVNRLASAYKVNDFAASRNGAAVVTDTSGAVPVSVDRLNIGADPSGAAANVSNSRIRQIAYFNTRQSNAQLQVLTAPV